MKISEIIAKLSRGIAAVALGASLVGSASAGDVDTIEFEAVLDYSSNPWYAYFERPYFEEWLPALSDGKLTGNAVPWDQVGMSGFEILKLLKIGTYDFGAANVAYVAGDNTALEGINLAGTLRNVDEVRAATKAYRPFFEEAFADTFNGKLLGLYPYPVVNFFCNLPEKGADATLEDLRGLSIRSYGATISDFIEGLGATPVVMPLGEVSTALQRGTIDCVATANLLAYTTKFYQVTTHAFMVSANYSIGWFVMNMDTWNSLTPASQAIVETSLNMLARHMEDRTTVDEVDAVACLGAGPCKYGEPANMHIIKQTEADDETIKQILQEKVLPSWAARCGDPSCIEAWNANIGPIVGMTYEE